MIRVRGDSYQVDIRHEKKRIRKSFPQKHEAADFEARVMGAIAKGLPIDLDDAEPWTMQRLLDKVAEVEWKGTANEVTAMINAEDVVDTLGPERSPRSITNADIEKLVEDMKARGRTTGSTERPLAAATINRKLAALSKMFKYALRHDIILKKPYIPKLKESEGRMAWLTPEQERTVLSVIKDSDFRRLVVFLLDTGCRLSDALEMDPSKDLDGKYVRFWDTKNGSSRAVELTSRAREAAKAGFSMFTTSSASKRWDKAREAAGLPEEFVLHSLRHTCATRLMAAGIDVKTVQQWLGHKTLAMTMKYAHLVPTNLTAAANVLERVTNVTTQVRSRKHQSDAVTGVTKVTSGDPEPASAA